MNYKIALIILIAALITYSLILFVENQIFESKRITYLNYIKDLFEWKFMTNYQNFNRFAEKFIEYSQDITYGLYSVANYNIYIISSLLALYSLIIIFQIHTIRVNNNHKNFWNGVINTIDNIKQSFSGEMFSPKILCIIHGVIFLLPLIFFIIYFFKLRNFISSQKQIIDCKIHQMLKESGQLDMYFKNIIESKTIQSLINFFNTMKTITMIAIGLFLMYYVLTNSFPVDQSNTQDTEQNHIKSDKLQSIFDFNQMAHVVVFVIFLFSGNIFLERLFSIEKSLGKLFETTAKISILQHFPKKYIGTENGVKDFSNLTLEALSLIEKHWSGVHVMRSSPIDFSINRGDKIIVISDKYNKSADTLLQAIVNFKNDQPFGKIFIKEKKEQIDLTKIKPEESNKYFYLSYKFHLLDDISIYENFLRIIPDIKDFEVDVCLNHALLKGLTSKDLYFTAFPRKIKYRILIALLFALEKNKNLVTIDEKLFDIYTPDELEIILNKIKKLSNSVILSLQPHKMKEYMYTLFKKIYRITGYDFNHVINTF